nr:hypothetical protein GGBNIMDK_00080 [Bacillus cereus]
MSTYKEQRGISRIEWGRQPKIGTCLGKDIKFYVS